MWCEFFVHFILAPYESVCYITLSTLRIPEWRVTPLAQARYAQEWMWCNDFVIATTVRTRTRLGNNLNTEMQMASFIWEALGTPPNYKLIKVCPSIKYWFWLFSFCRLSWALDLYFNCLLVIKWYIVLNCSPSVLNFASAYT